MRIASSWLRSLGRTLALAVLAAALVAFELAGIRFASPTVTIIASAGVAAPDEDARQAAAKLALRAPANGAAMPA